MDDLRRERAQKLSLMNRQKKLCNGEASGWECSYYWELTQAVDAENPQHLKKGETSRFCTLVQIGGSPVDLGNGGCEMAVSCNRYERSFKPFRAGDYKYEPLSPEEIDSLDTQVDNSEEYGAPAFDATAFRAGLGASEDDSND